MTRIVTYVYACGCTRTFGDGVGDPRRSTVQLVAVCDGCRLRAARAKREANRLYGKRSKGANPDAR